MRVVLDANVLISAALAGLQAEFILELIAQEKLQGFTSLSLVDEVARKLEHKFHKTPEEIHEFQRSLLTMLDLVFPATVETTTVRDPGDLHVLGTAVAAKADLLITTDRDLLTLRRYKSIGIIHPKTLRWTFPPDKHRID